MKLFGRIEISTRINPEVPIRERRGDVRLADLHRITENAYNKFVTEMGESKIMNQIWMQLLLKGLSAAPYIVAGIEHIHGDAVRGTDKKTLAMEALGLANNSALALLPTEFAPAIQAASATVSMAIDGIKATMNAAKQLPSTSQPVQTAVAMPTGQSL